jgi:hypothetical protein
MACFFMNYFFILLYVMIFLTQTKNWINGNQIFINTIYCDVQSKLDYLNFKGDNFYFNV